MAAFDLEGVDIDDNSGIELNKALLELQDSLQALDERFYIWIVTDKRFKKQVDEIGAERTNAVVDLINERNQRRYESGGVFTLKTRIFLLFTGDTGVYRFMDNVRNKMADDNESLIAAVLYALNPANSTRSAALHDARQLDQNIELASQGFASFSHAHSTLRFHRLTAMEMDSALYQMANPTLGLESTVDIMPSAMLDAVMASSDIRFGREVYAIQGPDRTQYGYTISLNGYPTNAGTLARLLAVPAEFRIVHSLHCLSLEVSRKALQENADYYEMSQSTLRQHAAAYLTGAPAEVDPGMHDLYLQCVEALRRNMAENLGFTYHSCAISFFSDTNEGAKRLADKVLRVVGRLPNIRERLGLKSAVLSSIPGQWAHNQRLMLANTQLVSNVLPITTIKPGPSTSHHLSSVYGRPMPALAAFTSRLGTEIHFDPFVGQVGHALVVIPTGGGKTTFVNYCLSCFSRYPDAQVVIFDRDFSCRIVTKLAGGEHLDMRGGMQLNPLAHVRDSDMEVVWATDFITRRVEEGGDRLSAEQRLEIHKRIKALAESDDVDLSLNALHSLLSRDIQIKLSEWVEGGPFAYFGSDKDQLEISQWTCIEMKEIMKVNRLSRAFLDHAFTSIARRLDGRPTFIYVEEASFALNNPSFLTGITEWLQTFRKKNAFVWLTLQSPESVSGINSEVLRATIADNIPNLILGANPRLEFHREIYKSMFGMTDDQVDMIGSLTPKRDYLRVTGNICRTMSTDFDDHVLAAVRSEPKYQALLDEVMASGDPNWRRTYLKRALERS